MRGASSHNGTGFVADGSYSARMPTLFRFLMILAILAAIAYGAMAALVWYVEPNIGEMTVRIPQERLNPQR